MKPWYFLRHLETYPGSICSHYMRSLAIIHSSSWKVCNEECKLKMGVSGVCTSHSKSLRKAIDSDSPLPHAIDCRKAVVLSWFVDDVLIDLIRYHYQSRMPPDHVCYSLHATFLSICQDQDNESNQIKHSIAFVSRWYNQDTIIQRKHCKRQASATWQKLSQRRSWPQLQIEFGSRSMQSLKFVMSQTLNEIYLSCSLSSNMYLELNLKICKEWDIAK